MAPKSASKKLHVPEAQGREQDEEPLVPHGLIWHATGAPPTGDKKAPAADEEKTVGIHIPPPDPAAKSSDAGVAVPGEKTASRTPAFWHSLGVAQPTSVEPNPLTPTPWPQPSTQVQPRAERPVALPRRTNPLNVGRRALGSALSMVFGWFSSFNRSLRAATARAGSGLSRAPQALRSRWQRLGLERHAADALSSFQGMAERAGGVVHRESSRLVDWIGQSKGEAKPSYLADAASRIRATIGSIAEYRVRIRITNLTMLAQIFLVREIAAWTLRVRVPSPSRELGSLLVRFLVTALLMLGLMVGARHYANQALPSHMGQTTPDTYGPPRAAQHRTAPDRSRKVRKTSGFEPKRASSQSARGSRHRPHDDDEDYVAPDTYVTYGSGGKRSR